jgi:type 1 glutamine amidotransferase
VTGPPSPAAPLLVVPLLVAATLLAVTGSGQEAVAPVRGLAVLVFTRTTGYRHESIPAGREAIRELGAANGFSVVSTEDPQAFDPVRLARFRAVVFLNTSGDVLDAEQQRAFEGYIRSGGGFVGVHAAADTEYGWPFYGGLVGAYFSDHPPIQPAAVIVEDRTHPATAHLPATWVRLDEWYNFRSSVRGVARVLARVDEATYTGGTMGADHPIAWCHEYAGGRSFYTAGGHTTESYLDDAFRAHLLGGIRYAAGLTTGGCDPAGS